MRLSWKIKRLLLKPSNRRVIDFFVDDDEYDLGKLDSEVGRHNIEKAKQSGLIKVKIDKSNNFTNFDTVRLTKAKGVPLMLARSNMDINWAKWAAVIAAVSVIATIATPLYMEWAVENKKTDVYYYAYGIQEDELEANDIEKIECWTNGVNNRSDSYKCAKGNQIITPCFRKDISNFVKCPTDPRSESKARYFNATFTEATKPINNSFSNDPIPWFIVLDSGEECGYLNGVTTTIANRRMDFSCKDTGTTLYLPTRESEGVYTIPCWKSQRLESCEIKEMWL